MRVSIRATWDRLIIRLIALLQTASEASRCAKAVLLLGPGFRNAFLSAVPIMGTFVKSCAENLKGQQTYLALLRPPPQSEVSSPRGGASRRAAARARGRQSSQASSSRSLPPSLAASPQTEPPELAICAQELEPADLELQCQGCRTILRPRNIARCQHCYQVYCRGCVNHGNGLCYMCDGAYAVPPKRSSWDDLEVS